MHAGERTPLPGEGNDPGWSFKQAAQSRHEVLLIQGIDLIDLIDLIERHDCLSRALLQGV